MNVFQKHLTKTNRESRKHFDVMCSFGDRMASAMGFGLVEMKSCHHDVIWSINGFDLCVRSFPQNGWRHTIVATPTGVLGDKIGYSNTSETLPESWYLNASGTATVFYPPTIIQDEILHRIERHILEVKE